MARHRAITVGDVVSVTTPLGNAVVATATYVNENVWEGEYTDDNLVTRNVTVSHLTPYTVLNRLY